MQTAKEIDTIILIEWVIRQHKKGLSLRAIIEKYKEIQGDSDANCQRDR